MPHNKVVVGALLGDGGTKIGNVVTVAKKNGDSSDVLLAIASIGDVSETPI